jgi:alpha-L-fucosidase
MNKFDERVQRTKWMMDDRFGLFIHWGLYSIPARGEWIRSHEEISVEDYQPYFDEFNPTKYNPKKWAKLAKKAGMKYAVLTTKHHDGFCLFDSKLTDYKATNTLAGRDLVREYVDAFRAEGIKVGFYYSLLDWHHPDYPRYNEARHPMRNNELYKDEKVNFDNYIEYFHGQVKELLTNYGKIDVMWFDFSYESPNGLRSGEGWKSEELVKMMRDIQPDIVIDNRLERHTQGDSDANPYDDFTAGNIESYTGDFVSPEQIIPPYGMVDSKGTLLPWEACITLNKHWGYASSDKDYKSAEQVIRVLIECISKGGNLLLNVGPNAKGEIPLESVEILQTVGKWMDDNGESIYYCTRSEFAKPEWGRYTQNGKNLYAHIYDRGVGPTNFVGLANKVKRARLLKDGSEIKLVNPWNAAAFKDDLFISFDSQVLPDEMDTVIKLELK